VDHMSSITGVGGSTPAQPVSGTPRTHGTASVSSPDSDDSLQKLQGLMKQIEGAANTRAIPAHQSW